MHQIAEQLSDADCWFTPYYSDSLAINAAIRWGWLDHTILGNRFRRLALDYLHKHGLSVDEGGKQHHYDLVVTCSDLLVQDQLRHTRSVWVQEGMTDPVTSITQLVKALRLPRYLSVGTSLNGSSNLCDVYCVASRGYQDFFQTMGTDRDKLIVTGIPNFDNLGRHRQNDFPYHDYVMVATSDIRETFRHEDRPAYIREVVAQAQGRRIIFKLHPNEIRERAEAEIRANAPADTLIFQAGDTNAMIANCSELFTQYSTVVYVGLALGKPVHSYFDVNELAQKTPRQNGGMSAKNIADVCHAFLDYDGPAENFGLYVKQLRRRVQYDLA